jgi:hypothetical protein
MKSPNESVSVLAKIPFREYIEWKKFAQAKGLSVSATMIKGTRALIGKKPPIQKEPWTEEEVEDIQSMIKQTGMSAHRRQIEAAAIRCTRAKRTAQNKDTEI